MQRQIYQTLAELLSYPEGLPLCSPEGAPAAEGTVVDELSQFGSSVAAFSLHEVQELFIQTFDLRPVCSLDMGWHLFGENYDRGLLLVRMRQQLRAHGIAETTELPDHLTYALRLLPCLEREEAAYFAEAIVLPGVEKILDALHDNPYEHVLKAARILIRSDFPEIRTILPKAETNLLPVLA